ncbi:MAG: AEC family transporter [Oscillospiraceae bacterium]|nr:AEC family transporter [Oscillospiraceae bacterium]
MFAAIHQILVVFFGIIVGYLGRRLKIITPEGTDVLSSIVVKMVLPLYLFNAIATSDASVGLGGIALTLALATAMYLLCGGIGRLLVPLFCSDKQDKPVYIFETLCANVTYVGIPVCTAVFGSTAKFYASLMNIPFSLLCFSLGIFMLSGKTSLRKAFNPAFVAGVLAVVVYAARIPVPALLLEASGFIGQATSPCAMLIIGSVLGGVPLKELFADWRVFPYCFIRLLLLPAVVMLLSSFLPIDPVLRGCVILMSAMPAATNATMLCSIYGGNSQLSAKLISISALFSMITIPVWTLFLS